MTLFPEFSWVNLFEHLFRTSVMGGLTVLLIIAAVSVFRRHIHVKWQYMIWLLIPLRLLLPWTPESPINLFHYVPIEYADPHAIADDLRPGQETGPLVGGHMIITDYAPSGVGNYISPTASALLWIWALGAAATGGVLLYRSVKFAVLVRKARSVDDTAVSDVFEQCKNRLSVRASIPLMEVDFTAAPALYGLWRPVLLLPQDAWSMYGKQQFEHIFTHELVHFKRKDIAVNWLMSLLLVLHWFNPLLWYAAYRMRADQEFSCDAAALSVLGPGEASAYGHTLITLLETGRKPHGGPRTAYFSGAKTHVRKRISMIARFRRGTLTSSLIGMLSVLLIGCAALTGHADENGDVVAEFRDYTVTKQMLKQEPSLASDELKIKNYLSWHMAYMEGKEQGIEPDPAAIDKGIDEMKHSTDAATVEAHRHWMGVYGLSGDAYWNKLRDDQMLSSVVTQYTQRYLPEPATIGGLEYKKRFDAFMDALYEKYKSEVKVYYDRLKQS